MITLYLLKYFTVQSCGYQNSNPPDTITDRMSVMTQICSSSGLLLLLLYFVTVFTKNTLFQYQKSWIKSLDTDKTPKFRNVAMFAKFNPLKTKRRLLYLETQFVAQ